MTAWQAAPYFRKKTWLKPWTKELHSFNGPDSHRQGERCYNIIWPFQVLFMAFGLKNAAEALKHLKDNILMGLDYVFSFLDDDGLHSKSKEQH